MTDQVDTLKLTQAKERLRQERDLFGQRMAQDKNHFALRLAIGWTTIVLFVAICAFCGFVIVNNRDFSAATVSAATSALLVEALGLLVATIKATMGVGPRELEPTTALREHPSPYEVSSSRTFGRSSEHTQGSPTSRTPPLSSSEMSLADITAKRATWVGLLLEAGHEFRDFLPLDEEGYLRVAGPAHADSRVYFGYSVVDEVLAAAAAIYRWMELLSDMEKPGQQTDRFWVESILLEQNVRIRKLVETLIALICFQRSNAQPYYRHLMLLHELSERRGTQLDLSEFYNCPSANIAAQVERLALDLAELEDRGCVDLSRCWYRQGPAGPYSRQQLTNIRPGRILTSARSRLSEALPLASPREKLALGMSYDRLYSRTSQYIHFSPQSRLGSDIAEIARATDECAIVGLNVLLALQRLFGAVPGEQNKRLIALLDQNPYPTQLSEATARGVAEVGDFVLAYDDLAEVLETTESPYGYRSYRVHYLAGSPMPELDEDWLPAPTVRLIVSRGEIQAIATAAASAGKIPEALVHVLAGEKGHASVRAAVVELWKTGLLQQEARD